MYIIYDSSRNTTHNEKFQRRIYIGKVSCYWRNIEWDASKVIIIPIRGLDVSCVGIKNVDNVLKCRNGVEHCIGQYLIENSIPILNY